MPKQSKQNKDLIKLEKMKPKFPDYVQDYIEYKSNKLAPSTLLGYLFDYEVFFGWLIAEAECPVKKIKDVPLSFLEELELRIANSFPKFMKLTGKSQSTIERRMAALKALFNYLQNVAEDDDREPLLRRNVMAKVEFSHTSIDVQSKADRIQQKILDTDTSVEEFRTFVSEGYGKIPGLTSRQLSWYEDNRERDLAIISLILGSGLRVSEIEALSLDDIDWKRRRVFVPRKGSKEQSVPFSKRCKIDMEQYMHIRDSRYKPSYNQKTLFLTKGGKPMSKNAMQRMVMRYSNAFGKPMSIHKLRHTFATHLYRVTKNQRMVQEILGHTDPKTTAVYTHIGNDEQNRAVDEMDKL